MKNLIITTCLLISGVMFSQTYVPNNAATLASSKSCFNQMMAAINGGDMAAFKVLQGNNCILVYDSSVHSLELVLLEIGGITEPNVYYIKGNPNAKIWALGSQIKEK